MRVALNNFRAFAQTPDIEVRPLTILVGENSTGKTSLLAALRFALELSQAEATSFFNSYPFDLGPFEDIVHSLGPVTTRHRFSIVVEKFVNPSQRRFPSSPNVDDRAILVRTTFFFKSSYGETVLSSIRMESEGNQMDFHLDDSPRVTVVTDEKRIELGQDDLFNPGTFRGLLNLETSVFMLMQFRFRREADTIKVRDDILTDFVALYDAFLNDNHAVVSSPPVRSVPRKVYTSSDDAGGQERGNAPHELSKIKRSDKRRWTRINKALNRFGRMSGLFNRFDIKKLTDQDSGPFQVKVTVRNRSSSISDVGYGVSQSLPIMTDLIVNGSTRSALLLQQPEVHLHPKAQAELGSMFAEFVTNNSNGIVVVETHSDHLIDRIRIEVREGRLNPHLVNIVFLCASENSVDINQISIDGQGNILDAPESYREFFIREQERILGIE